MTIAAVGIDVGGTHVRVGTVTRDGDALRPGAVRRRRWRDGVDAPSPSGLADVLAEEIGALDGVDASTPIGMAIAGQLDRAGRVVRNAPNLGWRDEPVAAVVARRLGRDEGALRLVNDLNAILAGELASGAAHGFDLVLVVYVGTGVGGALSLGGRVVTGAGGNAGEIGHVKVAGWSDPCGCGQRGCVESRVGGAAIVRRLQAAIDAGASGAVERPDLAAVDAAAADGCAWADALLVELGDALGDTIAGACTLVNPAMVVLGGGALDRSPRLRTHVEARVRARTVAVSAGDLTFASGALGDDAGWIGAASDALAARR